MLAALAVLAGGCADRTDVTIVSPQAGRAVYGLDTVVVNCHPARYVDSVDLLIDSVLAGTDTVPEYAFPWDVRSLAEGSIHRLQAEASVGSDEYSSDVVTVTVGYRSRILASGSGSQLRTFTPDGSEQSQVTPSGAAGPARARFAPGCSTIVFLAQSDHRLYRLDPGSADARLLYGVGNGIYHCDVAPAGGLVAFDAVPVATAHIFLGDDGGGVSAQLTHDGDAFTIDSSLFTATGNSEPVFSPDGQRIAWYRTSRCTVAADPHYGETRDDIFAMNLQGGGLVNLTPGLDTGNFTGITWTGDGQWVLFMQVDGADETVRAANMGGRTVTLPQVGSLPQDLACSPTGRTLAMTGSDGLLYLVGLDWTGDSLWTTGTPRAVTTSAAGRDLDWVRYP